MLNLSYWSCYQVVTTHQLLPFVPTSDIQTLTIKSYLDSLRKQAKLPRNLGEKKTPWFLSIESILRQHLENHLLKRFLDSNIY